MSAGAPPRLFVSTSLWEEHRDAIVGATADASPLLYIPGDRVPTEHLEAAEVACLSSDLWPEWSGAYLRVCLDAPNLRWLHTFSAGVDHPVFRMFLDRGVRLTTSSGSSAIPIAHHVMMSLLDASRDMPAFLRAQARHEWAVRDVEDLEGRTVGVVGMGPIGLEVARLATEFGMRAIGIRRTVAGTEPCETWTFARLDELLSIVDDLVLAVPLTAETTGLIGAEQFARMRPGARLVNIGRGNLVDEPAMIEALRSGHLGWAALDVTAVEPLPDDSPLWDFPNVVITPHSSGATRMNDVRAGATFLDNLGRFVRGESLRNEVR